MAAPLVSPDIATLNYRYTALAQLWIHQNACQLQWPVVIIGLVLVGLSAFSAPVMPLLVAPEQNWGVAPTVRTLGVCFIVASIGIFLMCRTMGRARAIMTRAERELAIIEQQLGFRSPFLDFGSLNHPPGVSGPLLLRYFLLLGVFFPVSCLGFLFVFGLQFGSIGSAGLVIFVLSEALRLRSR